MLAIYVRNVPEPVLAALKRRASSHGRSLQQEVLHVLTEAAEEAPAPEPPPPIDLVTVDPHRPGTWSREEIYGDEGR